MNGHAPPPRSGSIANVSVDSALLEQARALKVDIAQAGERGLTKQIDKARREQALLEENAEAIAGWMPI